MEYEVIRKIVANNHFQEYFSKIFTKEEDTPGSTWEVSGNPTGLSNRYYGDDLVRMLANKEYINIDLQQCIEDIIRDIKREMQS